MFVAGMATLLSLPYYPPGVHVFILLFFVFLYLKYCLCSSFKVRANIGMTKMIQVTLNIIKTTGSEITQLLILEITYVRE